MTWLKSHKWCFVGFRSFSGNRPESFSVRKILLLPLKKDGENLGSRQVNLNKSYQIIYILIMFSTYKKKHIILNFTISLICIKDTKRAQKTIQKPDPTENFVRTKYFWKFYFPWELEYLDCQKRRKRSNS